MFAAKINAIMSLDSILGSNSNLDVATKMLDVAHFQQKINAQNMANWMVPGAKKVVLDQSFKAQLQSMIEANDVQGVQSLQPKAQSLDKPIQYEEIMRDLKETTLEHQFLVDHVRHVYDTLTTAITGR